MNFVEKIQEALDAGLLPMVERVEYIHGKRCGFHEGEECICNPRTVTFVCDDGELTINRDGKFEAAGRA